jgi:D-arabinose 1-dehydrogenase-like Zn-dependent alcohol dehydrogenase
MSRRCDPQGKKAPDGLENKLELDILLRYFLSGYFRFQTSTLNPALSIHQLCQSQAELDNLKFFARPRLALDAVGGSSAARLSEALADGGQMIIYGCMSGVAPQWGWRTWVFRGLKVRGFNARRWMMDNRKKLPSLIESLSKLVSAGKIAAAVTEYELSSEFDEALDHALDRGKNTKVVLRVSEVGEQYDDEETENLAT